MRISRRPLVGLLLILLVVGAAAFPAHASSKTRDVSTFNVVAPYGNFKQRWRIVHDVDTAIARVPARTKGGPAPKIFIATFMFDREETVNRLIRACRRGVAVRVILDDDVVNRHARRLRDVLNADNVRDRNRDGRADRKPRRGPCDTKRPEKRHKKHAKKKHAKKKHAKKGGGAHHRGARGKSERKRHHRKHKPLALVRTWGADGSYVKSCREACRGPGTHMHSKFYVFSHTGRQRHVVKLSSSNLNLGAAAKGWNDMHTVRNRRSVYRTFAHVHRRMTKDGRARPRLIEKRSGKYLIRFYPIAKRGAKHDPVAKDLDKIRCRTPLGKRNRTKVLVSMFYWKGARGGYLANRLFRLGRKGCDVKVVVGAPSKGMANRLRKASRKRWITAYDSRWDLDWDGDIDVRTHAKFVLVKGAFGGRKATYRVMTGSGNWVRGSLTGGDEVSLNIAGESSYRAYARAWDRIRDHSRVMGRW